MTESTPVAPVPLFAFDSFQMDISRYRLSRGRREIPLRPKSWDVLRYLVERAGFLVTKDAIHRDVWPDVAVSDDALTKSIAELRRALGDTRSRARYIETVHGRGFRFIAEVREIRAVRPEPKPGPNAAPVITREADARFVGRQSEIERLGECLRRAGQRERQLVFITGEAGIGKTTLAEAFLHSRDVRAPDVLVLHGQCIKQRGQREPYMPVLEALERVLSAPVGAELVPLFRRVAPCWYVQIPRLLSEGEPAGFQAAMMTAPPERMLREIGAFLESAAGRSTIVLLLEDLHWSDNATADLLSFLAERRDPARLLVIGTFRPAEASTHEHPIREVRQTLRTHRRCVDLALDYLSTSEVAEYLRGRFGEAMEELAALVHHRTDGNPLFVVALVEELIRREQLVRTDRGWVSSAPPDRLELAIPEGLLEMVSMQFQSLPADERLLLEAASVVGATFTPATVARTVGRDAEEVDAVSQQMVRAHLFLSASAGGTGDRTPALRYEFAHALHHQVIYEQIPRLRRQRLHLQVAEALESTSGERLPEVAPELSVHFEQGGEPFRAAKYLHMCVARAQQRQAQHEAIACAELALDLLERVPDSAERRQSELDLRLLLGVSLNLTRGFSARAVRDNYERARALCVNEAHARQLFEIVHAVWYAQMVASKFEGARASIDELARIADGQQGPEFRLRVELARGRTAFWSGQFRTAVQVFTRFLDEVTSHPIERRSERYGVEPALAAYGHGSLALWFLGEPDRAREWARNAIAGSEESREPFGLASMLTHAAFIELVCGEADAALDLATRASRIAAEHAVATFGPLSHFFRGAALAAQGKVAAGLAEMAPALDEHREVVGSLVSDVMVGLLAAAYGHAERWDEGIEQADEGLALVDAAGESIFAAELWRVKGELLFGKARAAASRRWAGADSLAEAAQQCLDRALEIAARQEARAIELRSAMTLTRLARWRDPSAEAPALLHSLAASLTEGAGTADVKEAASLLATVSSPAIAPEARGRSNDTTLPSSSLRARSTQPKS